MSTAADTGILSGLDLPSHLKSRIHRVYDPPPPPNPLKQGDGSASSASAGFVLYLPTVTLRFDQNPAFAVACRAANFLSLPVVVLAVLLDDASHIRESAHPSSSVVMTSRRLAFALEALSEAMAAWSAHGAAVGLRLHGSAASHNGDDASTISDSAIAFARTPDHLTLASRASLVVLDEPFVSPHTTLVTRVERACNRAGVECVRVDGSCTVPPVQVLKKRRGGRSSEEADPIKYDGVPAKAYLWQKKTEALREGHLRAAMEGKFDAEELRLRLEDEILFGHVAEGEGVMPIDAATDLAKLFPSRWKRQTVVSLDDESENDDTVLPPAPNIRPLTSTELSALSLKTYASTYSGADPSVPPCDQTTGTHSAGMKRWNDWVQRGGLDRYASGRNDARNPHAPSRMSSYLNSGVVSPFRVVWEVKRAQGRQREQREQKAREKGTGAGAVPKQKSRWDNKNKTGADKFEEEIVKWREMSYAHAFSREDYDGVGSLPAWAVKYLNDSSSGGEEGRFLREDVERGTTGDVKWDAMQRYLVHTGELHNNVRMTWGKTVVAWRGCRSATASSTTTASNVLRTLCHLNDRYALDGLSPPSYAGLLWCVGWSDKPGAGGSIATKPASRYRMGASEFEKAERSLLAGPPTLSGRRGGSGGGVGASAVSGASASAVGNGSGGGSSSSMIRQNSILDLFKLSSSRDGTKNGSAASRAPSVVNGGDGVIHIDDSSEELDDCSEDHTSASSTTVATKKRKSGTIDGFFGPNTKGRRRHT